MSTCCTCNVTGPEATGCCCCSGDGGVTWAYRFEATQGQCLSNPKCSFTSKDCGEVEGCSWAKSPSLCCEETVVDDVVVSASCFSDPYCDGENQRRVTHCDQCKAAPKEGYCCYGEFNSCGKMTQEACEDLEGEWHEIPSFSSYTTTPTHPNAPTPPQRSYLEWYREQCVTDQGIEEICHVIRDPDRVPATIKITYSFMLEGNVVKTDTHNTSTYTLEQDDWDDPYDVDNSVSHEKFISQIEEALDEWKKAFECICPWLTLDFDNLGDELNTDIPSRWYTSNAEDERYGYFIPNSTNAGDFRFGMHPIGNLSAHAFGSNQQLRPVLGSVGTLASDMHLNSRDKWRIDGVSITGKVYSIKYIVAHELGHAFGLHSPVINEEESGGHLSDPDALMYKDSFSTENFVTKFPGGIKESAPDMAALKAVYISDQIYDVSSQFPVPDGEICATIEYHDYVADGTIASPMNTGSTDLCRSICPPEGACCGTDSDWADTSSASENCSITTQASCDGDWREGQDCDTCPECEGGGSKTCTQIFFKTYRIPDALIVKCDGEEEINTGLISTGGSFQDLGSVTCCNPEFCVCAPLDGTAWVLKLRDCATGEEKTRSGGKGVDECASRGDDPVPEETGACCYKPEGGTAGCSGPMTQQECEDKCLEGESETEEGADCESVEEGSQPPGFEQKGECTFYPGASCETIACGGLGCCCLDAGQGEFIQFPNITEAVCKAYDPNATWTTGDCGDTPCGEDTNPFDDPPPPPPPELGCSENSCKWQFSPWPSDPDLPGGGTYELIEECPDGCKCPEATGEPFGEFTTFTCVAKDGACCFETELADNNWQPGCHNRNSEECDITKHPYSIGYRNLSFHEGKNCEDGQCPECDCPTCDGGCCDFAVEIEIEGCPTFSETMCLEKNGNSYTGTAPFCDEIETITVAVTCDPDKEEDDLEKWSLTANVSCFDSTEVVGITKQGNCYSPHYWKIKGEGSTCACCCGGDCIWGFNSGYGTIQSGWSLHNTCSDDCECDSSYPDEILALGNDGMSDLCAFYDGVADGAVKPDGWTQDDWEKRSCTAEMTLGSVTVSCRAKEPQINCELFAAQYICQNGTYVQSVLCPGNCTHSNLTGINCNEGDIGFQPCHTP